MIHIDPHPGRHVLSHDPLYLPLPANIFCIRWPPSPNKSRTTSSITLTLSRFSTLPTARSLLSMPRYVFFFFFVNQPPSKTFHPVLIAQFANLNFFLPVYASFNTHSLTSTPSSVSLSSRQRSPRPMVSSLLVSREL